MAVFFSANVWAQDLSVQMPLPQATPAFEFKPAVKFETVSAANKDEIVHQENRWGFSARFGESGVKYLGASVDKLTGVAPWVQYGGYRALTYFDWQPIDEWNFSFAAGATELRLHHFRDVAYGVERTLPMWKVRSAYSIVSGTELRFEANNDFTYMGWLDRWDVRSQLMAANHYFAEVESHSVANWHLRTNAKVSRFEDSNQQQAFDHEILRDVLLSPFTLRVGAGGGWTRFQNQWPGYWNPQYFEYYVLRLMASKDLTSSLFLEAKINYGYHREIHRLRGEENAGEVLLKYRNKSDWAVNLKGSFLNSENGGWWKNDLSVYLEMPL